MTGGPEYLRIHSFRVALQAEGKARKHKIGKEKAKGKFVSKGKYKENKSP